MEQCKGPLAEQARCIDLRSHLGDVSLNQLMPRDRLAMLDSLLRVAGGLIECRSRNSARGKPYQSPRSFEEAQGGPKPSARLPEDIGQRNPHVIEEELRGRCRVQSHFLDVPRRVAVGAVCHNQADVVSGTAYDDREVRPLAV